MVSQETVSQMNRGLRIRWLGHASFHMVSGDGTRVMTDPYDDTVGYRVTRPEADIVTVSHNHFDHNAVNLVGGEPAVIKGSGERFVKGIRVLGMATFHDEQKGARRGPNIVFVIEMSGLRICHLGDLGHTLSSQQIDQLGKVDILMIPVGGTYTIDATKATAIVDIMNPPVVIPMHYKTRATNFPPDTAEKFLAGKKRVERASSLIVEFSRGTLPKETTIYVLNYE